MSQTAIPTTMPHDDICYDALAARDPRFDGRFFVGVTSTGIYCRAVCTAKTPLRKNCRLFESAAAAEQAGFRPCLKCRPELAPGIPIHYENDRLVRRAADMIRAEKHGGSMSSIAEDLSISERHLRRLFEDIYGITPVQYRSTCRLLLAKSLLTDTDLPISRIAHACGYTSLRRFNDAFQGWYHLSPTNFKKNSIRAAYKKDETILLQIGYRPPYRFDLLLNFLKFRAIKGVEVIENGSYFRTLYIPRERGKALSGWIKVENDPKHNRLRCSVSAGLADALPLVRTKLQHLFDTNCDPSTVEEGLSDFYRQTNPACHLPGIRVPGCISGFEMAVRAILGQQITVTAANTLAGRVATEFGKPLTTPLEDLYVTFPQPEVFCTPDAAERLGQLGVIKQRQQAICALAQAWCRGEVVLEPGADTADMRAKLLGLPGIGSWTLQYLLIRVFANPDALPSTDFAVKQAFSPATPHHIEQMSQAWRPWRSYATISLWSTPHES